MSCPIVIVDYDPRWPFIYEEEKRHILAIAGHKILCLEHIGSTAVVGLRAKPIVDIIAGVNSSSEADKLVRLLRKIGYNEIIQQSDNLEWYYCLRKTIKGQEMWLQNFHLHIMKFRSETWDKHILFRNFLRTHSEVAQEYDRLKRMLVAKYGYDRKNYTKAKTEFISSVITQFNEK